MAEAQAVFPFPRKQDRLRALGKAAATEVELVDNQINNLLGNLI